ncbi:MAG: glycosyltransferase involved in cell wall biosynthesis [Halieaceae bacterium]|jgi:glycosyltransferase involved in cell wall biosynthesis
MATWEWPLSPPRVSICCTVFNHLEFLEGSIGGFLEQVTTFPFEIIVHDDASTDGSTEFLRDLQSRYPSILRLVIQTENQWSKGFRMLGEHIFPLAKGQFIAICDGDDSWTDPQKLQTQVDFLSTHDDYVLCFTDAVGILVEEAKEVSLRAQRRDLGAGELQATTSIFTSTVCFRNVLKDWPRELANAAYGDQVLWCRLGDYGGGHYLGNVSPSHHRVHPQGVHSMEMIRQQRLNSLSTMLLLANFRLRTGDARLAIPLLQNALVLSFRVYGLEFPVTLLRRAAKSMLSRFSSR